MISGHGDDAFRFQRPIRSNFSSNVYDHVDLEPLKAYLRERLDSIGHYPEPEPYTLEKALSEHLGIDAASVCVTNGATEAIYLTAHAFQDARSTIFGPTFSEYADACAIYAHSAPLFSDVRVFTQGATGTLFACGHSAKRNTVCSTRPTHDSPIGKSSSLHSLMRSEPSAGWFLEPRAFFCERDKNQRRPASETDTRGAGRAMIWLCNPNNPTGGIIPKKTLVKAIKENPETVFVIDQSYGFFTKEDLLTAKEAVGFPNVIQIHSMTKRYAIPGLRLGYIAANPTLLENIHAVRMPWSVNALAIEAGMYLCEHPETGTIDLDALLAETQRLRDALNSILGLTVEPTKTHFFLCHLEKGSAAELKNWLAENHGILIRDASNFEGLDEGHFRIATQMPEENDALVQAIRQYLEDRR